MDKHTDRHKDAAKRFTPTTVVVVSNYNFIRNKFHLFIHQTDLILVQSNKPFNSYEHRLSYINQLDPLDLCEQCSKTRLRSASRGDYILPRSRMRCVDSSFSISAPTAWNNLPAHIRSCTSLSQFFTCVSYADIST